MPVGFDRIHVQAFNWGWSVVDIAILDELQDRLTCRKALKFYLGQLPFGVVYFLFRSKNLLVFRIIVLLEAIPRLLPNGRPVAWGA